MTRLRPLLAPAIVTVLMGAIFIGLGVWQLDRLAWKQDILARIEARTRAPVQAVPPPVAWAGLTPADYEYRRVTLSGTFDNSKEVPVFRGTADGAGYLILAPLRLVGGGTILVNRGWVPTELKARDKRAAGEPEGLVTLTGLMRQPEPRNAFTPPDDPAKGIFFTRDPAEIAHQLGLVDSAPFTVDADATPNRGGWPRGGATELAIPNNHLSYALTWFGLAVGLAGVFAVLVWKRLADDRNASQTAMGSPG